MEKGKWGTNGVEQRQKTRLVRIMARERKRWIERRRKTVIEEKQETGKVKE